MKPDVKKLPEGVALFRAVFGKIIAAAKGKRTRAEIARDIAAAINANYIECVDPDDPGFGELIDWVVRVLRELSKEPDEIGIYAAEVAKLLQGQDEEQE